MLWRHQISHLIPPANLSQFPRLFVLPPPFKCKYACNHCRKESRPFLSFYSIILRRKFTCRTFEIYLNAENLRELPQSYSLIDCYGMGCESISNCGYLHTPQRNGWYFEHISQRGEGGSYPHIRNAEKCIKPDCIPGK